MNNKAVKVCAPNYKEISTSRIYDYVKGMPIFQIKLKSDFQIEIISSHYLERF